MRLPDFHAPFVYLARISGSQPEDDRFESGTGCQNGEGRWFEYIPVDESLRVAQLDRASPFAGVAQSVELVPSKHQVVGSKPITRSRRGKLRFESASGYGQIV